MAEAKAVAPQAAKVPPQRLAWLKKIKVALEDDEESASDASQSAPVKRSQKVAEPNKPVRSESEGDGDDEGDGEHRAKRRRHSHSREREERKERKARHGHRSKHREREKSHSHNHEVRMKDKDKLKEKDKQSRQKRREEKDATARGPKTAATSILGSDYAESSSEDEQEKQEKRRLRRLEHQRAVEAGTSPARYKRPRGSSAGHSASEKDVETMAKPVLTEEEARKVKAKDRRARRTHKLRARRESSGLMVRMESMKQKRQSALDASREKRNQRERLRKAKALGLEDGLETQESVARKEEDKSEQIDKVEHPHRTGDKSAGKKRLAVDAEAGTGVETVVASRTRVPSEVKRRQRSKMEVQQLMGAQSEAAELLQRRRLRPGDTQEKLNPREVRELKRRRLAQLEEAKKASRRSSDDAAGAAKEKHVPTVKPPAEMEKKKKEVQTPQTGVKDREVGVEAVAESTREAESTPAKQSKPVASEASGKVEKAETTSVKQEAEIKSGKGNHAKVGAEEGEVKAVVAENQSSSQPEKCQGEGNKQESGETEKEAEPQLDMLPIPRKAASSVSEAVVASSVALSFVIPKKAGAAKVGGRVQGAGAAVRGGGARLASPMPIVTRPLMSPSASPQPTRHEPVLPTRKRKKNMVLPESVPLSKNERDFMRQSKKLNSIVQAAVDSSGFVESIKRPLDAPGASTGFEVFDSDGKKLPDLIQRLTCARKRDMAAQKDKYSAAFFGVALAPPKAKTSYQKTEMTEAESVGETDGLGTINCYEQLRFERPEDREFYQRKMYGTTFVPLPLRGRTTLIVRTARFERKSTGIRFNQDRDREEFAAALSKRYTINQSVPRCDVPREKWQQLMKQRPATVYLHYYNREDAERAAAVFRDDNGQPLEMKREYRAGVVISRNSSLAVPAPASRTPQRSCSSDRSGPEPSPPKYQTDSGRSTPAWHRERERESGDRQYRGPPPRFGGGGRFGFPANGDENSRAPLRSKSRSRSRTRSRSKPVEPERSAKSSLVEKDAKLEPESATQKAERIAVVRVEENASASSQRTDTNRVESGEVGKTLERKTQSQSSARTPPSSPLLTSSNLEANTTAPDKEHEHKLKAGEKEDGEEGEVESGGERVGDVVKRERDDSEKGGRDVPRFVVQRPPSPRMRHMERSIEVQSAFRRESDRMRGRSGERPESFYHPLPPPPPPPHFKREPERRRSRSRSRPRSRSPPRSFRGEGWGGRHPEDRRRSREFFPDGGYDGGRDRGRGPGGYPDEMGRFRDRGGRGGSEFVPHRDYGPRTTSRSRPY